MTEQVFWPNEEANNSANKINVTIFAWDYAAKRGTAWLPGGKIAEVRMTTVLTVISTEQQEGQQ